MTLYKYLSKIFYTKLEITEEIFRVASQIVEMGILIPKSIDDCQHIRAITHLEGYKDIDIMNPSVLLGGEE